MVRRLRWGGVIGSGVSARPAHLDFIEPAFYLARRAWIHIESGHFEAARRVIDEAEAELRRSQLQDDIPETAFEKLALPVASLPLCTKTINLLEEVFGVVKVEQLLRLRREDLRAEPWVGAGTLAEIVSAVEFIGLTHEQVRGVAEEKASREAQEASSL